MTYNGIFVNYCFDTVPLLQTDNRRERQGIASLRGGRVNDDGNKVM